MKSGPRPCYLHSGEDLSGTEVLPGQDNEVARAELVRATGASLTSGDQTGARDFAIVTAVI